MELDYLGFSSFFHLIFSSPSPSFIIVPLQRKKQALQGMVLANKFSFKHVHWLKYVATSGFASQLCSLVVRCVRFITRTYKPVARASPYRDQCTAQGGCCRCYVCTSLPHHQNASLHYASAVQSLYHLSSYWFIATSEA